jgi:hypothetical protein
VEGGDAAQRSGWLHPVRPRLRLNAELEEERLLLALTRAKDRLTMAVPQRF